jgi:hypothetical protein
MIRRLEIPGSFQFQIPETGFRKPDSGFEIKLLNI